jgi:DHA2 family multidrug resistance protein
MATDNLTETPFNFTVILLIATVILLSMMEALDMTIMNVALPNIMGAFSINIDTVTWIITAYILGSAVIMPIAGVLIRKMGNRKLLLISIIGFSMASLVCGFAEHFSTIIIMRFVQGVFGASLIPVAQYIIISHVDKKHYPFAMGCWAAGLLLAPISGPLLGGVITAMLGWRWLFFINLVVAIPAFFLVSILLKESIKFTEPVDYFGFTILASFLASLQFVLDRGGQLQWLNSKLIVYLLALIIFNGTYFIYRGIKLGNANIINFALFKNKKFLICTLMVTLGSAVFTGISTLLPVFLEQIMHYSSLQVGLISAPAEVGSMAGMILAIVLLKILDARLVIFLGIIVSIIGTVMLTKLTLNMSPEVIREIYIVRKFGFGIFFIPLLSLAFIDLSPELAALGSGIFNFGRNIGGSIGVAIGASHFNNLLQTNWNHLIGNITPYSDAMKFWIADQTLLPSLSASDPITVFMVTSQVMQQSYIQSFSQIFFIFMIIFIFTIPLLFFLGKSIISKIGVNAG